MNILKSCLPNEFEYGGNKIPIKFNKYNPTLESMVFIGVGLHDNNNIEKLLPVKKVILVSVLKKSNLLITFNVFIKLKKHEDYSGFMKNDIALITLMDDLVFSETIQPACLPSKDFTFPDIGSRGYIAGWGLTKNRDFLSAPDFLQNVGVNIYESTRCDLRFGNFSLEVTTE